MYRGEGYCGTVQTMTRTVLVDGNNVMGSRPDGWWRNRAEAAQRLVADIVPVARSLGGTWTVVFDGAESPPIPPQERVSVVHTGHGRRDGADDRIVELVSALPDSAITLVYTVPTRGCARGCVHWAPGLRAPGRFSMRSRRCGTRQGRVPATRWWFPADRPRSSRDLDVTRTLRIHGLILAKYSELECLVA